MSRLLFLDIDGVLNSRRYFVERASSGAKPGPIFGHIDPIAVARLQRIVEATGARIAISSTWRILHPRSQLRAYLFRQGLTAARDQDLIEGVTPNHRREKARGLEIQAYIDARVEKPKSVVILDDDSDMHHLRHRLVLTKFDDGLTDADADRAIRMLMEGT